MHYDLNKTLKPTCLHFSSFTKQDLSTYEHSAVVSPSIRGVSYSFVLSVDTTSFLVFITAVLVSVNDAWMGFS